MTLLAPAFTARAEASLESPSTPITSDALVSAVEIGSSSSAGISVNEIKSLNMSGVWRAVNLRAGVAAGLPLKAFEDDSDGNRQSLPATRWEQQVLTDPHPDMVRFEFWELVHAHRLLWGNAYVRILREHSGRIKEWWGIHPSRVKVGRESETGRKIYVIDGDTENPHFDDTIMHIPGFGYDGVCGVSPIRMARQSIGLGLAAEEFGGRLFGSGSLATGILQTDQRLTQTQADTISRRWKAKRSGLKGAHETIVLDRGAKFHQLTIPPEDAQFLQTRVFQINELCRWFGVPPFLMFLTEKSTSWGTGLEQQVLGWVKFDLKNDLERVEQRVSRVLSGRQFDPQRTTGVYAKFSVEGLLRGDSAARIAFYKGMWDIGAFSTNDVLKLEDRPPVDGGDVRYRPLNMGELGSTDAASTPPAPAPGAGNTLDPSLAVKFMAAPTTPEEASTDA